MRLRHPENSNLTLHYGNTWKGLPVLPDHGPLIIPYLDSMLDVMVRSLEEHPRTFAVRFDIHFPVGWLLSEGEAISRFVAALKARIEADLKRRAKTRKDGRRIPCRLRFMWVKEQGVSNMPHYHVFIFVNRDAYFALGQFQGVEPSGWEDMPSVGAQPNMAIRIVDSWASALGLPSFMGWGLVHFPGRCCYWLDVNAQDYEEQFTAAFQRASYFAKTDTKQYGDGSNKFGCSRG